MKSQIAQINDALDVLADANQMVDLCWHATLGYSDDPAPAIAAGLSHAAANLRQVAAMLNEARAQL